MYFEYYHLLVAGWLFHGWLCHGRMYDDVWVFMFNANKKKIRSQPHNVVLKHTFNLVYITGILWCRLLGASAFRCASYWTTNENNERVISLSHTHTRTHCLRFSLFHSAMMAEKICYWNFLAPFLPFVHLRSEVMTYMYEIDRIYNWIQPKSFLFSPSYSFRPSSLSPTTSPIRMSLYRRSILSPNVCLQAFCFCEWIFTMIWEKEEAYINMMLIHFISWHQIMTMTIPNLTCCSKFGVWSILCNWKCSMNPNSFRFDRMIFASHFC